jgi:NACalpha-BTF3-like transcription factor
MLQEYEGETESEKGYWDDVHYYMEQNNCDKETAIKAIEKIYDDYSKKRNA